MEKSKQGNDTHLISLTSASFSQGRKLPLRLGEIKAGGSYSIYSAMVVSQDTSGPLQI